jgi:hypothetical protein
MFNFYQPSVQDQILYGGFYGALIHDRISSKTYPMPRPNLNPAQPYHPNVPEKSMPAHIPEPVKPLSSASGSSKSEGSVFILATVAAVAVALAIMNSP